ncbi:hypothetical protein CR205_13230 [Alteribacter lacisalsi]|uniref:Uncharacterized protein n=1 Tax=Alteribacter lacisalsi TaxID=2045244 RepID=A0A2W0H6B7_9BACI|nr:hypothetical protein [Alteribacter lacisalsi]PYZ96657.1 hypothetical protein CR205_13230 [Alteribacter lacisalsi]
MPQGKTHDTKREKLDRWDPTLINITSIILIGSAVGALYGAIIIGDVIAYVFLCLLAALSLFLGIKIRGTLDNLDIYYEFGIDVKKHVFWEAKRRKGGNQPVSVHEIPFRTIKSILLAPYEVTKVNTGKNSRTTYYDIPAILMRRTDEGKSPLHLMTFQTKEDADAWLTLAQKTGIPMYSSDERINTLITRGDGDKLYDNGIYKEPYTFDGSVNKNHLYFNSRGHRGHTYHPEKTANEYDFASVVRFPLKAWQVLIATIVLFLAVFFIEMGLGYTTYESDVFHTVPGMIAGLIILLTGYTVYGYALRKATLVRLGLFFLTGALLLASVTKPGLSEDSLAGIAPFLIGSIVALILVFVLRQIKPAVHHFHMAEKMKRRRYQDQIEERG